MNRTQKRIIGFALVIIGLAMVVGAIVNAWPTRSGLYVSNEIRELMKKYSLSTPSYSGPSIASLLFSELLVSPLFYIGIILGVAGAVVLMGDEKIVVALKGKKKIFGWAFVLSGSAVSTGVVINSFNVPVHYGYQYVGDDIRDLFKGFLLNPAFYVGIALVVAGLVIIKKKQGVTKP
jgi:hypothetical protein